MEVRAVVSWSTKAIVIINDHKRYDMMINGKWYNHIISYNHIFPERSNKLRSIHS